MLTKVSIAVQGDRGSFSEQAAKQYSQKMGFKEIDYIYAISSQGVMQALQEDQANIGVIAIYNILGGVVLESQKILNDAHPKIQDVFPLDVQQNLLVLPGVNPQDIKIICSHTQALKQSEAFIKKNYAEAEIIEVPDTALAARNLAMSQDKKTAVIGCIEAAREYNLVALQKNIQDIKENKTVFIVIKK